MSKPSSDHKGDTAHTHKWKPLRQESSHDGACYHVGNCLVDVMYCEGCGNTFKPSSQWTAYTTSTGTMPVIKEWPIR